MKRKVISETIAAKAIKTTNVAISPILFVKIKATTGVNPPITLSQRLKLIPIPVYRVEVGKSSAIKQGRSANCVLSNNINNNSNIVVRNTSALLAAK